MKSSEQIKKEITEGLRVFNPTLRIHHYRAQAIFNEVHNEHPELFFYVQSVNARAGVMRFDPCVTYRLTYAETDIPLNRIVRAGNRAEAEGYIHSCIGNYQGVLVLCVPQSMDINRLYNDFLISYEGFYSNLIEISYETKAFTNARFKYAVLRFKYRIGRVKLNMMERAVDDEVEKLSRELFVPDMPKETIAYIAHNYLAKNVEYWLKEEANPLEKSYMQSAYGALINHRCVCQGYAEAYKRILDSQGICCEVICGKIRRSKERHAWNVVSFDGKSYFHVDVTWDSHRGGIVDWDYFCKTDAELNATRIWTRRSGLICTSDIDILSVARRQIATKKLTYLSKGIKKEYL